MYEHYIFYVYLCFRSSIEKIYYVGSCVIDQQIYVYWCLSLLIVFRILTTQQTKWIRKKIPAISFLIRTNQYDTDKLNLEGKKKRC